MNRQAVSHELVDADAAQVAAPRLGTSDNSAIDLVRRWRELSELERRAFLALTRELTASSDMVERKTDDISKRFQALASIAGAQVGRVDRIVAAASALDVDGKAVPLDEALRLVENTLAKAIDTILFVSKHAMRMVYTLEDVARDVAGAEQCSGQIEVINRQARYLALNAAIEAGRSGASGAAFSVIAHEMKQLSQATEQTAVEVRSRISAVTEGVRRGHDVLREIATLDLSENILAKERIDSVLAGIAAQHQVFGAVLAETATASTELAGTVGQLVTGMQFQDRAKQLVAQVIETLAALEEGTAAAQTATDIAFPGLVEPGSFDQAILNRILEKQTMSAMKSRMLARLLTDDGSATAAEPEDEAPGDIELF
jgi:methyl-accepting chemotaxis protein